MIHKPLPLSALLKDPAFLLNGLLRLLIWGLVAAQGRYLAGDSWAYLEQSHGICSGRWGGVPTHVPLYPWFLCAFSWAPLGLSLLVQTAMISLAGVLLYRATYSRKLTLFWLFDPVLLIYSTLVMTDAFFAVGMLGMALALKRALEPESSLRHFVFLGVALAVCMLTRPIGMPFAVFSLVSFVVLVCLRPETLRGIAAAVGVAGILIAPRLYWNVSRVHLWTLSTQADGWIQSLAGVVENKGLGLTFLQCEHKWIHDHPGGTPLDGIHTILQHPVDWLFLSIKGMARVLVGHVNMEWAYLFTGRVIEGPGWFKETGQSFSTPELLLWVSGLLTTLILSLVVYFGVVRSLWRARAKWSFFPSWCICAIGLLVAVPQLFGDARFRAPIWALVLVLWAWAENQRSGEGTR